MPPQTQTDTIAELPAAVLHHLAALAETREHDNSPWARLDGAAIDELVELAIEGRRPGYSWWRQHLPRPATDGWPTPIPHVSSSRWEPWELVASAIQMVDDRTPTELAYGVLADLAARHRHTPEHLADAYRALTHTPTTP